MARVAAEDAGDLDRDHVKRLALHRRQSGSTVADHGLDRLRNSGRLGKVAVRPAASVEQVRRKITTDAMPSGGKDGLRYPAERSRL
jgi:hypothetical protein